MCNLPRVKKIGGKEPGGKPAALGPWTFSTKIVRDQLLPYVRGDVLNVFAGKTRLSANGANIIRNDINPEIEADYHLPASELVNEFGAGELDVVILDPPYNKRQAEEHYDGEYVPNFPLVRKEFAKCVGVGGYLIEFGFDMWGMGDYSDAFDREDAILFRRGVVERPPVFMTVDKRTQMTLG